MNTLPLPASGWLEYTLKKPFDKLIKTRNIKDWTNIAVNSVAEFEKNIIN